MPYEIDEQRQEPHLEQEQFALGSREQALTGCPWYAHHGLTASGYQQKVDEYLQRGFRPIQVSGFSVAGEAQYAAVWEKDSGSAWAARHGLTGRQYQDFVNEYLEQGFRLTCVSGYDVGGQPHYAAIMEQDSGPAWYAHHGLSPSAYQEQFDEYDERGYRLTHLSGYTDGDEARYAAIWEKDFGPPYAARHGLTAAQYQEFIDQYVDKGFRPTCVSGYTVGGETRYAAVVEKMTGPVWVARHGLTAAAYQEQFDKWDKRGYRLTHVSGYSVAGAPRYAAIWDKGKMCQKDMALIANEIHAYRHKYGVPGISLAISNDERCVFARGYGDADKAAAELVTPAHRFRIASISKPITAVAIMEMAEAGQLQLDRPVFGPNGILGTQFGTPPYSDRIQAITVRHLLQHTSGWSNQGGDPMFMHPEMSQTELIGWVLDNREPTHVPGTQYTYLNFGYCVLGRILEEVSPQHNSYEAVVKAVVLEKCDISNMTLAGNTLAERRPNEVVYYGSDAYEMEVTRMDAHGGWIATPIDLLRFVTRVDGFDKKSDILEPETAQEAFDLERPREGYGEGWMLRSSWRGHNGAFSGSSGFLVRRDDGFSFAVLANSRPAEDRDAFQMRQIVADLIDQIDYWPEYDLFDRPSL